MRQHKAAILTIATACLLDILCGIAFAVTQHIAVTDGLYWAVTTATTVGLGDIVPKDGTGKVITVVVALLVVPLFAATFSLFTASLTTKHAERRHDRLLRELAAAEARIKAHHRAWHEDPPLPEAAEHGDEPRPDRP